jgi:hypothetical protein
VNLFGVSLGPPSSTLNVLWDGTVQLTTVTTDSSGNLSPNPVSILIPDNATGATHQVCIEEYQGVNACANFTLEPVVSVSPSPSPSPSPSTSPSAGALPAPPSTTGGISALALLVRPPFVFLPVIAIVALLFFLAVWVWRSRPTPALGEVTVHHLAAPPRQYEPLPPPPPVLAPAPPPVVYESPGTSMAAPPAPPPPAPSGADVPPDMPEASD